MNIIKNATTITVQVIFIITFISIFFFVYTSIVEHNIVVNQINNLITGFIDDIKLITNDDEQNVLKNLFSKMNLPDMSDTDNEVKQSNKILQNNTMIQISIIFIIGISICTFFIVYFKLDWKHMLKESFAGLTAVALIEFIFLTFFAQNYKTLDPNSVKLHIIDILKNYSNS